MKGKRGLQAVGVSGPYGEYVNGQSIIHDKRSTMFYKKAKCSSNKRPTPYNVRFKSKRNFRTRSQIFSEFVCPH